MSNDLELKKIPKCIAIKLRHIGDEINPEPGGATTLLRLSRNRKKLEISLWRKAEIAIYPANDKRQFVMVLKEPARTYKRFVMVSSPNIKIDKNINSIKNRRLACRFSGLKGQEKNVKIDKISSYGLYFHYIHLKINHAASVNCFLIGYDEEHLFISQLKKVVRSVEEAHKELIPKEIKRKKDCKRMGEFFFVPVTESKELSVLNKRLEKNETAKAYRRDIVFDISTELDKNLFTIGRAIQDSAVITHKPIFLRDWHRVVRNNEIPNPSGEYD